MAKKHKHEGLGHVGERGEIGDAGTWNCPDGCGEAPPNPTLGTRLGRLVGLGEPVVQPEATDDDDDGTE